MKTYGEVEAYLQVFLITAIHGGKWSASRPGYFTPGRAPGTHCIHTLTGNIIDYCEFLLASSAKSNLFR